MDADNKKPISSMTDPLHAYQGEARALRDAIERLVFAAVISAHARTWQPGTLHTANDIMALVEAAYAKK